MKKSVKSIPTQAFLLSSAFALLFTLLSFQKLSFYIRFDFNFILLLLVLPFVLTQESKSKSLRFGFVTVVLLVLFFYLKLNTLLLFAFICSLFFLYEFYYNRLSVIPLFLVMVASPVTVFVSKVVGFEIRLGLTKIAVRILQLIDSAYHYSGNIIYHGENEFQVDNACMGLKMVILSLFTSLLILSYQQQKRNLVLNIWFLFFSLMISYLLVIISNLSRIVMITLLNSGPETLSHQLIGIFCFIFYVALPLYFLFNKWTSMIEKREFQKPAISLNRSLATKYLSPVLFYSLLIVIMGLFAFVRFSDYAEKHIAKNDIINLPYSSQAFNQSIEEHGVQKFSNDEFLIYIKPAAKFFSTDHSPIICWKGSGYQINREEILNLENRKLYYCTLEKGNDVLHSSWWYDSGDNKTISQFNWRFSSLLHNRKYRLINVIANNKQDLIDKSNQIHKANIFE